MDTRLPASLAALVILLCACQSPPEASPAPVAEDARSAARAPGKMAALPFRLDLTFSPEAASAAMARGVPLIVQALYYGAPKPPFEAAAPPGVILNEEVYTTEARDGAVRIRGAFDLDLATALTVDDPRVQVTVSQAAGPDITLLICDIFDEALPLAVETGGTIHCELAED